MVPQHAESKKRFIRSERLWAVTGLMFWSRKIRLVLPLNSGDDFRTKIRRINDSGVNMTTVSAVYRLKDRVIYEHLDRRQVRSELVRISNKKPLYNRWLIVFTIGFSCAAFSRLFGGDLLAFGVTFLASSLAMFVRQELNRHYFNPAI